MTIRDGIYDEVSEIDLHAYADGLLTLQPDRVRRIEDYLQQHAEDRLKVEAYRRQRDLICHAYGNAPSSEIPTRLREAFGYRKARRRNAVAAWAVAIAATALLGVPAAMMAGDFWNVTSWTAYDDERAQPATATASSTISMVDDAVPVALPDFSSAGLNYIGHETYKLTTKRTIWRLRYADAAGNEVELLVTPRPNEPHLVSRDAFGQSPYSWSRGEFVFSMHSNLPLESREVLARIFEAQQPHAVPAQLQPPGALQGPAINAVQKPPETVPGTGGDALSSQPPHIFPGPEGDAVPIGGPLQADGPLL
jgi:hypothetical protein